MHIMRFVPPREVLAHENEIGGGGGGGGLQGVGVLATE